MQLEELDDKIREAAEHHHPAYNEKAWPKMEKLLDKHLPQKKDDRRRFLFLLMLFLLTGSGAWLLISKPWKKEQVAVQSSNTSRISESGNATPDPRNLNADSKNNPVTTADPSVPGDNKPAAAADPVAPTNTPGNANTVSTVNTDNTTTPAAPTDNRNNNSNTHNLLPRNSANRQTTVSSGGAEKSAKPLLVMETGAGNKNKRKTAKSAAKDKSALPVTDPTATGTTVTATTDPSTTLSTDKPANAVPAAVSANNPIPVTTPAEDKAKANATDVAKKETNVAEQKPAEKPIIAKKSRKGNNLAISFSAGPDLSMIGFRKIGEVRSIIGAGLSYTFAKRLTVSAGVYSTRKVYTAAPSDYKFSYRPPGYNYMTKIDGDCKVLEIPVSLSWTFGKGNKKGNWYAGAGLASLLMKKEKYDYEYKYPSGTSYTYTSNHSNENKHLFSILTVSGGYRRNISRNVFVSAEPYLQIPVNNGVGAGKIKLNSTGVLFSIGIKPFAR